MTAAEAGRPTGLGEASAEDGEVLRRFEAALDPARPARDGVEIIGYGEVSTVFALAALPGRVCKRMAGFRGAAAAERYVQVVDRYLRRLAEIGVRTLETAAMVVPRPGGRPVVYLVQPRAESGRLGNHVLVEGGDEELLRCVDLVLGSLRRVLLANRSARDGRAVAVDGQLSNWVFPARNEADERPVLIDVGTPFMRRDGADEMDLELFLAPAPPLIRAFYRRSGAVRRYIDDYFDARKLLLDQLGNFHKEGRPDRIPLVLAQVNRWLERDGADLGVPLLTRASVDRYYEKDAKVLELYLRLRRLDRFVRTRLLGQRYDFILPGPIRR